MRAEERLQVALAALADIANSQDMTLEIAKRKAGRVYLELIAAEPNHIPSWWWTEDGYTWVEARRPLGLAVPGKPTPEIGDKIGDNGEGGNWGPSD